MSWPRHSRTNLSHSKKQVLVTPDNPLSESPVHRGYALEHSNSKPQHTPWS